MNWIGLTATVNIADVHVDASQYGDFHLRFNRSKCDQLCPNNRRLILGIEGNRLYFKEVRTNDGYKYVIRGIDEHMCATLHNHNKALNAWARNGSDAKDYGFDSELYFDEVLKLFYTERPEVMKNEHK